MLFIVVCFLLYFLKLLAVMGFSSFTFILDVIKLHQRFQNV